MVRSLCALSTFSPGQMAKRGISCNRAGARLSGNRGTEETGWIVLVLLLPESVGMVVLDPTSRESLGSCV